MSIYTKTGDKGTTAVFGGSRLVKSHPQIDAYGSVDELSSMLGMVIASLSNESERTLLTHVQRDLHHLMAQLSGASVDLGGLKKRVGEFEEYIDAGDKTLNTLTQFILPQGSEEAARIHVARSVCRRAERVVVLYLNSGDTIDQSSSTVILQYLNRMSDFLFQMARMHSKKEIHA